ncbi:MAG: GH25 family lysozyme, partial [Bacteroidota bacterium]
KRTTQSGLRKRWTSYFLVFSFLMLLLMVGYHYRVGLAYYLGFKSTKAVVKSDSKRLSDVRNFQVLNKYNDRVVGIDVSQYQGVIDWKEVKTVESTYPIRFVYIRATAGRDKVDSQFKVNWQQSKKNGLVRGAYHYYRPNENSIQQARFFTKHVQLERGDLPPVLDIESIPANQSIDSLKVGLRRWLTVVDERYQIRPIIYTSQRYYEDFLKEDFADYQFWIANYNFFVEEMQDEWLFWQFTEKASIDGIRGNVDLNIYNGTMKMLQYQTKH